MNKGDLVNAVVADCGLAKGDVEKVLNSVLDSIKKTLSDNTDEVIQLIGFGSFSVSDRKARQGFNPRTKEPIEIPASKSVKFKPGSALKEAVNK